MLYKLIIAMVLTVTTLATMTACHTIEGMGQDTEAAGDAISDTARDAHN